MYNGCAICFQMRCGDKIPLENESAEVVRCVLRYLYSADIGVCKTLIQEVKVLAIRYIKILRYIGKYLLRFNLDEFVTSLTLLKRPKNRHSYKSPLRAFYMAKI